MTMGNRLEATGNSQKANLVALALCAVLIALYLPVEAQQAKKVPRLGFVNTEGSPQAPGPQFEAFRQGLRDLGYIEGGNILIDRRYPEENTERTARLVTELVQLKVDLLVLGAQPAIRAAKQATKTIPIVFVTTQNPVAAGFVESLARPVEILLGLPDSPGSWPGNGLNYSRKCFRIHRASERS